MVIITKGFVWELFLVIFMVVGFGGFFVHADAGGWFDAHATFYGADQNPTSLGGACGYDNTFHAGFGINTAAVSSVLFKGGEACGACFLVICNYDLDSKWCLRRRAVAVTTTNFCPSNNNGGWCDPPRSHFDMSSPAFLTIARQGNEGIVPVLYKRVSCKREGGVRFTLRGQSNFNMVMISNVGGSGDLKAAWVKGSRTRTSTWTPMHRNWGANWQANVDLRNQRMSFKLTLVDGTTLEFVNVVPSSWRGQVKACDCDHFHAWGEVLVYGWELLWSSCSVKLAKEDKFEEGGCSPLLIPDSEKRIKLLRGLG